jgi:ABC-2 type transport system permease protein
MRIFFREFKANLKSLLIWCGIMTLFIFLVVAKYSAFAKDPALFTIINSMPKALIDVLSMRSFNLTTLNGFYGLMFIYFALMGGIAAAMWASESVSKEEREKTVEFSLVLPVSRSKVITAKLMTSIVNCFVFVLVTWGVSLVAVRQFSPDSTFYSFLRVEMEAMFVIELVFLAVGFLLGCAMKRYKRSGSTAVAVILVTYILSIISTMQPKLDFLKYFTPFRYFDAGELYRYGTMNGSYLLLSCVIIVACVGIAYWVYNKRDLYI